MASHLFNLFSHSVAMQRFLVDYPENQGFDEAATRIMMAPMTHPGFPLLAFPSIPVTSGVS